MAARSKPAGKKRRNPNDPPPAPSGSANPQSRAFQQARAIAAEGRAAALEAALKAYQERDTFEAHRDEQGGVVSAERMRKVMGQPKELDKGPTEERLREWLDKDVKTYTAEMAKLAAADRDVGGMQAKIERLELENAALKKAATTGPDDGSAEADRLITRILAEHFQ